MVPKTEVFIVEGFHVPVIGVVFEDVVGRVGALAFKQYNKGILGKVRFTV